MSTKPENLPPGITDQDWCDFEEMRRRIRVPLTPRARELVAAKLCNLMDQGQDPKACFMQSIENGWRSVFPVRVDRNGTGAKEPEWRRRFLEEDDA